MVDRVDDRLAQPLAVTGDQPQPRVGGVHRALDSHLDQRFGIAPDGLAATEYGLKKFHRISSCRKIDASVERPFRSPKPDRELDPQT
jgi:hypothetical protein